MSGVTSENPFQLMNLDGRIVICVVSGKTMFMTESQAVMHAYSKGCTGAHAMGDPAMYMAGATHTACDHSDATTTTSGAAYSSTMMSQNALAVSSACVASLLALLTADHKKSIKKEACWTISNITAGNKDQIQAIVENNIVPPLVYLLAHAEFDIKKEAAWALSNATSGGTHQQIKYLVEQGCIKPLPS